MSNRTKLEPKGSKSPRSLKIQRPVAILLISLIGLAVIYVGALLFLRPDSPGTQLSLTGLIQAANRDEVNTALFLDQDARVIATVEPIGEDPHVVWVSYPRSDAATNDLLKNLIEHKANVTVDLQPVKGLVRFMAQFLLPLVVLANLFALLFYLVRGAGGGGTDEFLAFGTVGDKRLGDKGKQLTTFRDVAASEEALAELAEVRDYLDDPAAFERMGALPPKGVLIIGPPGCGKTLMARAVAGEAKAAFFSISGSEFVESLVGIGAARVRDLFQQAYAAAPSILFIDELDAVGRQRGAGVGGGHDEREQTLNELLVQMDGFSPTDGVAVLAATNRVDILDPALLRPGRFDRHLTVERPDAEGRLAILRLHAHGKLLDDPDTDLPVIARRTAGFTGADLAAVLNEAALLAVRERARTITNHHLEEAVERIVAGPKRKGTLISPADKQRIATHEAGHAVVAAAMGKAASIEKLSIIARGRGIGHLAMLTDESLLPTRHSMEAQIAIAMGGIAAEELILGQPSTGAEADLERATNNARDMAGRFGMSPRLGRARLLREHREVFLGRDYLDARDVSQPTLEHLDAEVRRILDEQEHVAHAIIEAHRRITEVLAYGLTERETLGAEDLSRVLARVRPSSAAVESNGQNALSGTTAKGPVH